MTRPTIGEFPRITSSSSRRTVSRLAAAAVSLGLAGAWGCSSGDGSSPWGTPAADAATQQDAASPDDADAAPDAAEPDGPLAEASEPDGQPQDAAPATLGTISVQALHDALPTKDFLLINVHIPYQGEIPQTDAKISYLEPDAIAAFVGANLDQSVVVYCLTNHMSTIAGQDLVDRGYRSVRYLDGGMSAWTAAGYTLENNP